MRIIMLRGVLAVAVLAGSVAQGEVKYGEYPYLHEPACNHTNKQEALYLQYTVKPDLHDSPAHGVWVETNWTYLDAMRRYGSNGVFAAHPFSVVDGPGGYFGSQADGSAEKGGLLFSIWDKEDTKGAGERCRKHKAPNATWCEHLHSFPLSSTCRRHCLDCGLHPGWDNTTGTQCELNFTLHDGDTILFHLFRSEHQGTVTFEGNQYEGNVWTLSALINGQTNVTVGTVLFEDSRKAIDRFGAFHEHIGCTPCKAFQESEMRTGPFFDGHERDVTIGFSPPEGGLCKAFNVTLLPNRTALFQTG